MTSSCVIYGHLPVMFISMIVWGVFFAAVMPTLDALLADSASKGQRSRIYSWRNSLMLVGSSVGPVVTFCIFLYIGDVWTISECRTVILIGLALFIIPVSLLFLMKSNMETVEATMYKIVPIATDNCSSNESESFEDRSEKRMQQLQRPKSPLVQDKINEDASLVAENADILGGLYVPSVIAACDIISGLASGMTIKFFPIFFMDNLHLSPLGQSALFTVSIFCNLILTT